VSDALYIVDGSNFLFRAYHALPYLSTKAGTPTGAVYGFAQMLIKLEQEFRPSHLAVVFDVAARSFRHQLFKEYKSQRPPPPEDLRPQFDLVRKLVDGFNVPRIELAGVEADDVIATLATRARARALRVVIVSSDKDLMQLVGDEIVLLDTMKNNAIYGPGEVEEKFGVPPARLGDLLALMGDSVDNVPGIPGVGPKTAAILLQKFASIEEMIARADEVAAIPGLRGAASVAAKVKQHADGARLSRKLVELERDVALPPELDLDQLQRREPEMARVETLLRDFEFERLIERLRPAGSAPKPLNKDEAFVEAPPPPPRAATAEPVAMGVLPVEIITDRAQLQARAALFAAQGPVGVAIETVGPETWAPPAGIALAVAGLAPIYVPLGHRYLGAPAQISVADAMETLKPLLSRADVPKHIHDHKRAHILLARHEVTLAGVAGDPELAGYLLDPAQPHDLTSLAARHGATVEELSSLIGKGKSAIGYDTVEIERAAVFLSRRAEAAMRLGRPLDDELERAGMRKLLHEVELPLSRVLAVIERHGVKLDVAQLHRLGEETQAQLDALEREVRALAGYEINLGSPKQLSELLFDKLHLPASKKTKTGYSTDADVLEELAELHPIAAKIHEHRAIAKLKGTYIDALPKEVDQRTGRLHTSYDQAVAATGRLSSRDPNLQNIPIRSELGMKIRRAFIADQGCRLVAADYSQIELRVLAHLSHDMVLRDAFDKGQDVHQRTAMEMFRLAPDAVTPEHRRIAKAINFGIIYGQTDFGLARAVGISRDEARRYIADYFARYAGVAAYMERLISDGKRESGSRTLLGRFRPLPDIHSKNRTVRQYAERMARNTPIQGTAADLIKLAMIEVQSLLEREAPRARMLLTVHDELVLEAPESEAERVGAITAEAMEKVWKLDVPLKVDVGIGENWAEC
jgi:DNA polymerase-1